MMKNLIIILFALIAFNVNAQSSYKALSTGSAADTLVTSETFAETFKINSSGETQTVKVDVAIDSVSGTPSATATLYESLDGINYVTTGLSVTFTTGVDTTFAIVDTAFYGIYGKLEIVATATAQKSRVTSNKMQWGKR